MVLLIFKNGVSFIALSLILFLNPTQVKMGKRNTLTSPIFFFFATNYIASFFFPLFEFVKSNFSLLILLV